VASTIVPCESCRQVLAHRLEHALGQTVLLQQMAELAHRRLVRGRLAPQVDAHEPAHRCRVVQRFFHRRVRQRVPLLQEVNAQHALESHHRPTAAVGAQLRIERLDQRAKRGPRHDLVHLGQEDVPARRFAVPLEAAVGLRGQGQLLWHRLRSLKEGLASTIRQNQGFLRRSRNRPDAKPQPLPYFFFLISVD